MSIMFLTVTVLTLAAVVQADVQGNFKVIEKRGAIGASSPTGLTGAQREAYLTRIRQYQQAQAQAQAQNGAHQENEVRYVPKTSKYTGSPVTYNSGTAPAAHYQPQQQANVYSQNDLKQLAYSKTAYQTQPASPSVPHFSLASDVSTFSYSSPVVRYNNLGLLSQLTGKQTDEQTVNYESAAPKVPVQRTIYYQPGQTKTSSKPQVQYVPQYEFTQKEPKSEEQSHIYLEAFPKYSSSSQGVPQPRYVYVSTQESGQAETSPGASQQFVYQAIPQSRYQQQVHQNQPKYETKAPSDPKSIYVTPQQYQPQQFSQQKHGVIYAN